jgi:hypothetical protein
MPIKETPIQKPSSKCWLEQFSAEKKKIGANTSFSVGSYTRNELNQA